jgi:hypothetical protein
MSSKRKQNTYMAKLAAEKGMRNRLIAAKQEALDFAEDKAKFTTARRSVLHCKQGVIIQLNDGKKKVYSI